MTTELDVWIRMRSASFLFTAEVETALLVLNLYRFDEQWLNPFLFDACTRGVEPSNRTIQDFAFSDIDRSASNEIGTMVDSSTGLVTPALSPRFN